MTSRRSPNHIRKKLEPFGFHLGRCSRIANSFTFHRQREDGLYEWIACEFLGRKHDAAVCWIGVSATQIIPLKGLTEKQLLEAVASDKERGWTLIHNAADQREWESNVVEHAIPLVRTFAAENCHRLIRVTSSVSRDADLCLTRARAFGDVTQALDAIQRTASGQQQAVALRMAEWPGVKQVSDEEEVYELACYLVVTVLREDDLPNPETPTEMPLENEHLMQQIQLIADRLLSQRE